MENSNFKFDKLTDFKFKKPTDVESYIALWGWMDYVVNHTKKKGVALNKWRVECVPHRKEGKVYGVMFGTFFDDENGGSVYRPIKYADLIVNPYFFTNAFNEDMKHYKRLYTAFCEVMAM